MSAFVFMGLFGAVLLLAGAGSLALAWRGRQRDQLAASALTHATGKIVKLKNERRGSDTHPRSYPVVEFTTISGARTVVTSRYPNVDRLARQVGDSVDVQYAPEDPAHADIARGNEGGYSIMMAAGAILLLLGVILLSTALRG